MGVTYKLKDEVVQYIVSQRQANPLSSCRQLAESASQKFGLHLSKSSVHDVLKESGIVTPRGRKPKDKFEIPQEKKKQIQVSLSQVKLIAPPAVTSLVESKLNLIADVVEEVSPKEEDVESPLEYEGAGKIFLKAALWDLGIFSEENIKEIDWDYYLTYSKGVKVILENDKNFFIDLQLPIERCIREVADGLINNIRPFIAYKVSDETLFRACMDAQAGFKINKIEIVDRNDHILIELSNIMETKRTYLINNRQFVVSENKNILERAKTILFPQVINNDSVIDNILSLKGFDTIDKDKNMITLLIDEGYENKAALEMAIEILNGMYLTDEQGKLVKVKIKGARNFTQSG